MAPLSSKLNLHPLEFKVFQACTFLPTSNYDADAIGATGIPMDAANEKDAPDRRDQSSNVLFDGQTLEQQLLTSL